MEQYDHWYRSRNRRHNPAAVPDPVDKGTEIENNLTINKTETKA